MNGKETSPGAGNTEAPEAEDEQGLPTQKPTPLPVLIRAEDLTANQLMWLLADLSPVGNECRLTQARETLAKYGITAKQARQLFRKKWKKRRVGRGYDNL
jgi:hypothetical protein